MCKNKVEDKCCGKECSIKAKNEESIKIDIDRMKASLESQSVNMPLGLNREEKRQFILKQAKKA
jgi:hypothetical protein